MNPRLILALVIAWISSCGGSAWLGWDYRDGKVAQEKLDIVEEADKQLEEITTEAEALKTQLSALRSSAQVKDRIITKEVTRYVEVTPADQRCTLPGTWRVLHDAAATGIPSEAEAGSMAVGTTGPVEDAAAIETVAENYANARECFAKLAGWQRRDRAERDLEK